MSSTFGYKLPGYIINFNHLRIVTYWAGCLGVAQSITWMALTITSIMSYNCLIPINHKMSYGSLIQIIFMDLYFKGDCTPDGYVDYESNILRSVVTILDAKQVLIWACIYLGAALIWLLASVLLLNYIKKDDVKLTTAIIYTWALITFCICAMDLSLGVIFGIDYGNFNKAAYTYNLNPLDAGIIEPNAVQLVAAMVTSISLMIISFKGFVLWIVNFALTVHLLVKAIFITTNKDSSDTLFIPRNISDDVMTNRPPINAFEEHKTASNAYNNEAYIPDNQSTGTIELNQEAIARAARMSTDVSLQDHRFRNLDTFQQYPPPSHAHNNNSSSNNKYNRSESYKQETEVAATATPTPNYPAPDYSPPMQRVNHNQSYNAQMRTQRL